MLELYTTLARCEDEEDELIVEENIDGMDMVLGVMFSDSETGSGTNVTLRLGYYLPGTSSPSFAHVGTCTWLVIIITFLVISLCCADAHIHPNPDHQLLCHPMVRLLVCRILLVPSMRHVTCVFCFCVILRYSAEVALGKQPYVSSTP